MENNDENQYKAYDKEVAFHVLDNVLEMVSRCDTKISYLLSAMSLATLFELNLIDFNFFKHHVFQNATKLSIAMCIVFIVGSLSVIMAVILSIHSLTPKLKPLSDDAGMVVNSSLYFGTIKAFTYSRYLRKCRSMNNETLYNDIVSQIYINSAIADKKYKLLQYTTRFFMISFVCLLLFIILQNGLF